ncbi:MAG: haloacid dehalogenase-like hydrolase [Leptospiraceae bacterium]|nr:haloacid dehalogenase-like hydrolase [Leptospiraceae bacterium]MDW7976919.1 HAD family hydrolase [Leptospiraceae bacterium]
MKKTNGYAIFDLDYTILPYDTMFLFANYILKKERWRMFYLILIFPLLPLALLGLISTKTMKEFFLSFLWGISKEKLETYSKEFVENEVLPKVSPEILKEIQLHAKEKVLILNTAAPDFYVKFIGKYLEFDMVISTHVEFSKKWGFPKIIGKNNKSTVKVENLLSKISDHSIKILSKDSKNPLFSNQLKNSISFSDSYSDLPLLKITEKAKLINPDDLRLLQEAKKNDWEILQYATPFRNKWQKYYISLLQVFGLF